MAAVAVVELGAEAVAVDPVAAGARHDHGRVLLAIAHVVQVDRHALRAPAQAAVPKR